MALILLIILLTELRPAGRRCIQVTCSAKWPNTWKEGMNAFQVLTKEQIGRSSFHRNSFRRSPYKTILHFNISPIRLTFNISPIDE